MIKTRASSPPYQIKAKLFRGFSDRSRLSILETLRGGGLTVGDIADATGLMQPNASNHLKCLSECGLVVGEQNGRFVRYRLADHRITRLLQLADQLLVDSARLIEECGNYRETCSSPVRRLKTNRKPVQHGPGPATRVRQTMLLKTLR